MTKLIVVGPASEREISATTGQSIMQILRDNGVEDILAVCGGVCSCATCHVYVDPAYRSLLPRMLPGEDGLLEGSAHRTAESRLSCQLPWSDALDGVRITVAPED